MTVKSSAAETTASSKLDEDNPYQRKALLSLVICVYSDTTTQQPDKKLEQPWFKSTQLVLPTRLGAGYHCRHPEPTAFFLFSTVRGIAGILLTLLPRACTCMHWNSVVQSDLICSIRLFQRDNPASLGWRSLLPHYALFNVFSSAPSCHVRHCVRHKPSRVKWQVSHADEVKKPYNESGKSSLLSFLRIIPQLINKQSIVYWSDKRKTCHTRKGIIQFQQLSCVFYWAAWTCSDL